MMLLFSAQFLLTNILVVGFQAYSYPLSLKKKSGEVPPCTAGWKELFPTHLV